MKKLALLFLLCVPLLGMNNAPKTVYICTGPHAKVYHSTTKCKGLENCSKEVKVVSYDSIKGKRRACKLCW